MSTPLPSVIIRVPASQSRTSGRSATICQEDGSPLPFDVQHATVDIDWDCGDPVTVDIRAVGRIATDAAAGLRTVTVNGVPYRLTRVGKTPHSDAYRAILVRVIAEERKTALAVGGPAEDCVHQWLNNIERELIAIDAMEDAGQ